MLLQSPSRSMPTPFQVCFSKEKTAIALQVNQTDDLSLALKALGFEDSRLVMVLVGGASGLKHDHLARLHTLFRNVLAPLAEALNAIVIDGGTDAGVMQMMGTARKVTQSTFPLVGVLPIGVATLPDALPPCADAAALESNHTHFILIPGENWGDESLWIAKIASTVANGASSVTVLVNGGEITWRDAKASVQADRPIVQLRGADGRLIRWRRLCGAPLPMSGQARSRHPACCKQSV